jgi:hypothetical protein
VLHALNASNNSGATLRKGADGGLTTS